MIKTCSFKGDAFAIFKKFHGKDGLFFLDSSLKGAQGRYSYIGVSPFKRIVGNDLGILRREFERHQRLRRSGPFSTGAVGSIAYNGHFCFGFYDQVIRFDHVAHTATLIAPTRAKMDAILTTFNASSLNRPAPAKSEYILKSNFSRSSYMAAVKKALRHITAGDIYQINLSRKVEARFKKGQSPLLSALYGALRRASPSPFAAYFDGGEGVILSSSPERFLKLSKGIVQVKPMKGTRPRGNSNAEDGRMRQDLLHSPKEIAELLMVTDLERNDLGRVCAYGTIKVKTMRAIEAYRTVFQATATIEGKLMKGKDAFDLLEASFPSGSVTGCPKIEAMKIIRELEGDVRGAYTGALGYISFEGDMDFSVLIRSLFVKDDRITFHVGGGIVADSDPASEYTETCIKAKAMESALRDIARA